MKQVKKKGTFLLKCVVNVNKMIIISFLILICVASCHRKQNGTLDYMKYSTIESYKTHGGNELDYYLGYILIDGYDTQESNGDGTWSSSSKEIKNGLYTMGIMILLVFIMIAHNNSTAMIKNILSILIVLLGIHFAHYSAKEGGKMVLGEINHVWRE